MLRQNRRRCSIISFGYALKYYADFVKPTKTYRAPTPRNVQRSRGSRRPAGDLDGATDGESLQTMVFAVGTEHVFEPLRAWFTAISEGLPRAVTRGTRFGGFVALYGVKEWAQLVPEFAGARLARKLPLHRCAVRIQHGSGVFGIEPLCPCVSLGDGYGDHDGPGHLQAALLPPERNGLVG